MVITGLILAGGQSSRMGVDKASLVIDGQTLLDRTQSALRAAGAERVVISGARPGGIADRWAKAGPVGGIASAAAAMPDGELLVVPVDMPRLGNEVLGPLLTHAGDASTCWDTHPLPMRLTLNAATRRILDDMMTRTGRDCSVSALQARVGVTTLPLDGIDTRWLVNCNTPDEWREVTL